MVYTKNMEQIVDTVVQFILGVLGGISWLFSVFSNPELSNVLSALLGAVFGSLSGYWFNRKLESSRTKERYLIQRKNTIYSPIYKQLLSLKQYLNGVNSSNNKSVDILLKEAQYSHSGSSFKFLIWTDVNKDVRKSYITAEQRIAMERLITHIAVQHDLQEQIKADINSLISAIIQKYYSAKKSAVNSNLIKNTLGSYLESYVFPYSHTSEHYIKQRLTTDLNNYYTISDEESSELIDSLLMDVKKLSSYQKIDRSLQELIDANDAAIELFELIIRDIINRYEGGL